MTDEERIEDLEFKVEVLVNILGILIAVIQHNVPMSRINYIQLINLKERLTKP